MADLLANKSKHYFKAFHPNYPVKYEESLNFVDAGYFMSKNFKYFKESKNCLTMDEPKIGKRLSAAVGEGRLEDVQSLLHCHGLAGLPDGGYTLLCIAVEEKHFDIAKLLITSGAAVTLPVRYGNSPLHWACAHGSLDIVQMLLDRGADVSAAGVDSKTPLHCAVEHRHVAVTKLLLECNADPSIRDEHCKNSLHVACEKGCAVIVELLLQHEVDVSIACKDNMTTLHLAAECGSWQVTKLLLAKGASFNTINLKYQAPLHIAAHKGHLAIVEMLVEAGASVICACESAFTPLHYAAASGIHEIVDFLLDRGAMIDETAMYHSSRRAHVNKRYEQSNIPYIPLNIKYTPLHIASQLGNTKVIELLLERGADVNAKTADGTTPLLIAIKRRLVSVMRLLLQRGSQDVNGKAVLQTAIKSGSLKVVQEILNHKPDIKNKRNQSCIKVLLARINNQVIISRKTVKHPIYCQPYMRRDSELGGRENNKILEALLSYGFSVNDEDAKDSDFYRAAVSSGCLKVVEDLVMKGANINAFENESSYIYPLHTGIMDESAEMAEYSPLHQAARDTNYKMAELLIRLKADVNTKDKYGKTPIFSTVANHFSAKENIQNLCDDQKDMVELLIKSGSDVNIQDIYKKAVIFYAVENSNWEMVRLLIANNADVNIKDDAGKTAIFYASNFKISQLLLKNDADFNIRDNSGKTLFFSAVELSNFKMIEFLVKNTVNLNSTDSNGRTPIFYAVKNSDSEIVQELLKYKANANIKLSDGTTALHIACEKGKPDIVKALLESKADANAKLTNGTTALHIACEKGKADIVNTLLEGKSNVNAKQTNGQTPLHSACKRGDPDIIKALLIYDADVNAQQAGGKTALHLAATTLEELLDYGGDIDVMPSVLDLRSNSFFVRPVLRRHVFKLNVANMHVPHHNIQLLSHTEIGELSVNTADYRFTCEEELARMMSEQIENTSVSFHDILMKNSSTLAKLVRNEVIMSAVKSSRCRTKYPVYVGLMLRQIHRGVAIKNQQERATQALQSLFPQLPLFCVEKVLNYLSSSELEVMVDDFKLLKLV